MSITGAEFISQNGRSASREQSIELWDNSGRQYIIVAVGGGIYTSEYIAFALPQSELVRPTTEVR